MAIVQLSMTIDGMTCGGCTASVQKAIQVLAGVTSISVSLSDACAIVGFDDAVTGADAIITAVEDAGFDVVDTKQT